MAHNTPDFVTEIIQGSPTEREFPADTNVSGDYPPEYACEVAFERQIENRFNKKNGDQGPPIFFGRQVITGRSCTRNANQIR
jgi:hypothetical protein